MGGKIIASVKFFLTNDDKLALKKLGYSDAEIKAMKPDAGAGIIAENIAKTL